MAWRIGNHVIKGVLDNRQKGLVVGNIWLTGCTAPITLELHGNFLRDMAGCELFFENPRPATQDMSPLDTVQIGLTGDMTASRKVNVVESPPLHGNRPVRDFVARKANALYIEWFSETNGRVVIESTDFIVNLSPPAWTMTAEEDEMQTTSNRESFREWLEHLSEIEDMDDEPMSPPHDRPMDEFEWERLMRDSDRKNERLGEVLEKYHGHPDSEKLIAREMGWTWVEEELEAQERGVFAEVDDEDDTELFRDDRLNEEPPFELRDPDPVREGLDWVRDSDGSVEHPLAHRALQFSAGLWKQFEDQGLLGENGDSRIFEWVGQVESAGVRLSNTLGDLAYGEEVENGFIVAGLKRAVHHVHCALETLQQLEAARLVTMEQVRDSQKNLFALREAILALMNKHRRMA